MATSGEESAGSGISGSGHSPAGRPSRAPQLVRARSGPATLSHAVFEMLYVELRSVLGGLRKARMERARDRARTKAAEASSARRAAAAAAASDAVAASADAEPAEGGQDEEAGVSSEEVDMVGMDRKEAPVALDGEGVTSAVASTGTSATVGGGGGEGGEGLAKDDGQEEEKEEEEGEEEEEEEEKAVFQQLADMQDDVGCLKLSRELQVWRVVQGFGIVR